MVRPFAVMLLFASLVATLTATASAQQNVNSHGRYLPLNQYTPPGVYGQMNVMAGVASPHVFQPVRVKLPTTGKVTFFDGSPQRPLTYDAPAQAGLLVGRMYRLRISDMPELPQGELFPSIELVDQLHPPPGQAERFPVEVELLPEEIAWAANGRMVTKVVYLEQPDRVPLEFLQDGPRVRDLPPAQNAVAEADELGRPIAIVRIGGRTPDPNFPDVQFWGQPAPVRPSTLWVEPAPGMTPTAHRGPQTLPAQRSR